MDLDNGLFSHFGYGLLKLSNNIYLYIILQPTFFPRTVSILLFLLSVFKIVKINY